ncbi:unnamed protein product [Caretta caretta]
MSKKGRWQKLKEAKERRQRQDVVLKGTPSLLAFFSSTKSAGEEVQVNASPSEPAASAPDQKEQPPVTSLTAVSPHSSGDFPSGRNSKISFSSDPGKWGMTSQDLIAHWTEKGPQKCQNLDADFSLTKRECTNKNRYLTKSMFEYVKPNKQIGKREWLIYSPSKKKVHWFYCHLFSDTKSFDEYEIQGVARTANHEYKSAKCCKRQKTCNNATAHTFSNKEAFSVNTFITIISKLKSSLEHRIETYENIDKPFRVLTNFLPNISNSEVSKGIKCLFQKYPDDLPVDFTKEFLQFVEFTSLSDAKRKDDKSKSIWMY